MAPIFPTNRQGFSYVSHTIRAKDNPIQSLCSVWQHIDACQVTPGAATALCVGAFPIAGSCARCWVSGLCRTRDGPPFANDVLEAMIDSEPALASSTAPELAGATNTVNAGHGLQTPAAHISPEGHLAQASSSAAGTVAADETGSRAEAAQAGSMPRESGLHAAPVSASSAPSAGSGAAAAGLSWAGQASSSDAIAVRADAGGHLPAGSPACNAVAERSTAHRASLDSDSCDATEGLGRKEQTSAAQSSPVKTCSVIIAGIAAAVESAEQLPSHKIGRQPADPGSTQSKTSCSTHAACAGKQQAAHGSQTPDVAQVRNCGLTRLTPHGVPSRLRHPSGLR